MGNGMNIDSAQRALENGDLSEIIVSPAETGNGWVLSVKTSSGDISPLTDSHGHQKIHHSLDHATAEARQLGFTTVHIEERF